MPFSIGPAELVVLLVIALVVVGPGRLPDVAASLGRTLREFRKAASDVRESSGVEDLRRAASDVREAAAVEGPRRAAASAPQDSAARAVAPARPPAPDGGSTAG